jgi:hypothetical protein
MTTAGEILREFGLNPPSTAPGRYYTTCPKCSVGRSRAHQKSTCLGITIDEDGVQFGCNHCDYHGGGYYNGKGNAGADLFAKFDAVYDYADESGAVIRRVCKKITIVDGKRRKEFPQCAPNGKGRWTWTTKGVRFTLYRLPEIIEAIANERTLLLLEGEKDVESAWRLGIPATCNPGGASEPGRKTKWRKELSEQLRGADIVIIPDHDAAGYAHAESIAQMSLGIAKRIRVLKLAEHWPPCPDGGDLSDWLDAGHTREELDALIEQAPDYSADGPRTVATEHHDGDVLPELIVNSADPTATAKDLAALIAKRTDFLFNGHAPVRIAAEADCLPRALEVTPEAVRVMAHEICMPTKELITRDSTTRVPAALSKDIAGIYLHGLEGSWGLRAFHGITTAPILSDDGTIRTASGYDARTGLWCHNIPAVAVPARPSKPDAERALSKLRALFRTFPFADAVRLYDPDLGVEVVDVTKPAGLDESAFLAALLTAVCRQSLDLAPGLLCDAPNISGAGTGKGLLVKSACVIASGARPSAFTSGHDAEEFEKRLASALIEAQPSVFVDNYNAKMVSSDTLASALTESPAKVRLMGKTGMVPLHVRTFIGITGNAVEIAEDQARRWLNVHLDARMEHPEQRPFAPGFLERIHAERPALLAAALTIWRWGRQTRLAPGKPIGSYEHWAMWCRDPLLALGLRDPVDRHAEIKAADPKRRALVAVFDQWWTSHGDLLLKAQDLDQEVVALVPGAITRDGTVSRQRVAGFLAMNAGARVGGYCLIKLPLTKKVAGYKLTCEPEPEEPK